MTHARSSQAELERNLKYKQKRFAKKYIFNRSFRDYDMGETVNRATSSDLHNALRDNWSGQPILIDYPRDLEHGEILSDTRGRGTLPHIMQIISGR